MGSPVLYFHAPCFDGIVSAALTGEYLETRRGWAPLELCPANYSLRGAWLGTTLPRPAAVVDFLYHPQADFWADHHGTTFVTPAARLDYEARAGCDQIYDPQADSCAGMLWRHLPERDRPPRLEEAVKWANHIDAARYATVEEALWGEAPAMRVHASLAVDGSPEYCRTLVRALRSMSLAEVAEQPAIAGKSAEAKRQTHDGIQRLRERIRLAPGGIATFEVEADGNLVNRYGAFWIYPAARYALGVLRSATGVTVRANCNPWLAFESPPLGEIFAREGGGGHQRVGSVVLPLERQHEARAIADRVEALLRTAPPDLAGERMA